MPGLLWNRRHNIATLTVSFSNRIWHSREVGDLLLGYAATGRLARVIFLDPRQMLAAGATAADAAAVAIDVLRRSPAGATREIEVLQSALLRAGPPGQARSA